MAQKYITLVTELPIETEAYHENSWMTDGGFNMVKQKNRVIVNSNYDVSHPGQSAPKLRAVRPDARDYKSQHGGGRGVGGSHYNNGRCDIFLSTLHPQHQLVT